MDEALQSPIKLLEKVESTSEINIEDALEDSSEAEDLTPYLSDTDGECCDTLSCYLD